MADRALPQQFGVSGELFPLDERTRPAVATVASNSLREADASGAPP
jgi:hypothetical protein